MNKVLQNKTQRKSFPWHCAYIYPEWHILTPRLLKNIGPRTPLKIVNMFSCFSLRKIQFVTNLILFALDGLNLVGFNVNLGKKLQGNELGVKRRHGRKVSRFKHLTPSMKCIHSCSQVSREKSTCIWWLYTAPTWRVSVSTSPLLQTSRDWQDYLYALHDNPNQSLIACPKR